MSDNQFKQSLREGRENEFINFFLNMGDYIKNHRLKKRLRLEDVSRLIKDKYGEDIHPSILSRYENKKIPIKSHHAAFLFDVLEIYLEDAFYNKIVIINFAKLYTDIKFQYLIKEFRYFFSDDEIINMINTELHNKLNYSWKVINIFKRKNKLLEVGESQDILSKDNPTS